MPITIAPPLLDQPTGPGFFQAWETDLIGPIAAGSFWRVKFSTAAAQESTLFQYTIGTDQHQYQGILGAPAGHLEAVATSSNLPANAPAHMTVELVDGQSVIIDSGGKNVVWDPLSGIHSLLPFISPSVLTGGYTDTDRSRDAKTNAAVLAGLPLTELVGEIAEVALDAELTCPPGPLLVRSNEQLLSGRGTVDRPAGATGVNAYGFWFRFEVVPPGLSVQDGVSLEYPERMAQFLVIKVDADGFEYVSDRYDFHHDQERVCWGIPFPKRVEYSILPGVTLRFSWLVFKVGQ